MQARRLLVGVRTERPRFFHALRKTVIMRCPNLDPVVLIPRINSSLNLTLRSRPSTRARTEPDRHNCSESTQQQKTHIAPLHPVPGKSNAEVCYRSLEFTVRGTAFNSRAVFRKRERLPNVRRIKVLGSSLNRISFRKSVSSGVRNGA